MTPKQLETFKAIVDLCNGWNLNSINVASKARSEAIVEAWNEMARFRLLLERWAELIPYTYDYQQLESEELKQLLADTQQAIK